MPCSRFFSSSHKLNFSQITSNDTDPCAAWLEKEPVKKDSTFLRTSINRKKSAFSLQIYRTNENRNFKVHTINIVFDSGAIILIVHKDILHQRHKINKEKKRNGMLQQ